MNRVLKITRLHLCKPGAMFGVPLQITVTVLAVSILISVLLQRGGISPDSAEYLTIARANSSFIWAFPGYLIYYGVQATATTYPFALAIGTTRRAHVLGTALANMLLSLVIATVMLVLLGLELATDHWFMQVYALDVNVLGTGNPIVLFLTVFFVAFVATSLGGFFGAVWVRFGQKGPTIAAFSIGLVVIAVLLILGPQLGDIIAELNHPMLAGIGCGVAVLALFGTWIAMRRASVR